MCNYPVYTELRHFTHHYLIARHSCASELECIGKSLHILLSRRAPAKYYAAHCSVSYDAARSIYLFTGPENTAQTRIPTVLIPEQRAERIYYAARQAGIL